MITRTLPKKLARRSETGVSAVEFALIAPVMVAMLFGAVEASLAVTMDRKVTIAASTVGDLVAQDSEVTCARLQSIFAVSRTVFAPYSGVPASISVAGLKLDGTTPKVEWSVIVVPDGDGNPNNDCQPSPAYPLNSVVPIGADLFATNGGLVVGRVEYVYQSVGTSFFASPITLTERFYLRPRQSAKVRCTGGPTATGCV
jgi:Flp pilus assembly protein TadG